MQRGRVLESAVLHEAEKQTGLAFRSCDLQLLLLLILDTSPDAIGDSRNAHQQKLSTTFYL